MVPILEDLKKLTLMELSIYSLKLTQALQFVLSADYKDGLRTEKLISNSLTNINNEIIKRKSEELSAKDKLMQIDFHTVGLGVLKNLDLTCLNYMTVESLTILNKKIAEGNEYQRRGLDNRKVNYQLEKIMKMIEIELLLREPALENLFEDNSP